jgi:hypothetical protein
MRYLPIIMWIITGLLVMAVFVYKKDVFGFVVYFLCWITLMANLIIKHN